MRLVYQLSPLDAAPFKLARKTALVTGSSQGIGEGIAILFAEEGATTQ